MKKISLIIQEILKFFLIFLILFVWIRYFVKRLWLATLISTLLTSFICLALFFVSRKKRFNFGMKLKEKESAENIFLSLAFENNPMDFFYKLATKRHHDVTKHKNYLTIEYKLEGVKTVLWFDNSFEGLNVPRLCDIYSKIKKENATKIVICCYENSDKNLPSFIRTFKEKFVILDRYKSYEKLYKLYACFPEITKTYPKEKSLAFKDMLKYSFNKKKTKSYLFSALILIFSGLFVRVSIYYCLIASLLIVFALISQFNITNNPKNDDEII